MNTLRPTVVARLILIGFACSASLALAQSSTTTAGTTSATSPTPATASNPTGKLVGSFTALAGSTENATSLVNGLRTGSAITLTDPKAQTGSTTTTSASTTTTSASTTFSPGTKPMGYGNIRIALSLAQTRLASQGITNPTPAQLQGALVGTGGTTGTATQGILQMRASGMGWGQIANSMGVKLGAVMSGKQTTATATTAAGDNVTAGTSGKVTTGRVTTGSTASSVHGKSGVVTAAGGAGSGNSQVTTGLGLGGGHAAASGAVNAAGGRSGAGAGGGGGQGHGKP